MCRKLHPTYLFYLGVERPWPTSFRGFAADGVRASRGSHRSAQSAIFMIAVPRASPFFSLVTEGQVGWLDRPSVEEPSLLRIAAGDEDVRLVLYAGEPQNVPISAGGPFIGDSREDIARLYSEYRQGVSCA